MRRTNGPAKRSVVALAALALVAAACGQYGNVHRAAVLTGQIEAGVGSLSGPGASGSHSSGANSSFSSALGGTAPTSLGASAASGAGSGTSSAGTAATASSSGGSAGSAQAPPAGGDSTGITATSITLGLHAPVTGAAPVSAASFLAGANMYWKYGNNGKPVTIFGRHVHVVAMDDHYNPSYARQVCQQMVQQDHAFALMALAGTDQIKACAEYAQSQGVPYLSSGVTETELSNFSTYFAVSATYPYQTGLLDQYIKHDFTSDTSQVVMVAEDTPNFDDAVAQFQKDFPGAKVYRPAKNDGGSSMAANICAGPQPIYKVVFPLVAPVYYLEMAKAASCHPQYLGIGLSTIDQVASTGCAANRSTEGAQFFNPSPAWQDRNRFDPSYERAIAAARKAEGSNVPDDDIVWLEWGLMKDVAKLLQAAGRNPTRQGFVFAAERARTTTRVYAPLAYTPADHFGAHEVNVIQNVCKQRGNEAGYYVTKYAFKGSF